MSAYESLLKYLWNDASAEGRGAHRALTQPQQHQLLNRTGLSADTVTKPT